MATYSASLRVAGRHVVPVESRSGSRTFDTLSEARACVGVLLDAWRSQWATASIYDSAGRRVEYYADAD